MNDVGGEYDEQKMNWWAKWRRTQETNLLKCIMKLY